MKIKDSWSHSIVALITLLVSGLTLAADAPVNKTLPLPERLENQEMRIIEIELAPGQSSAPHRHNAHVYVYVLEGEIEMQVRGGPLVRLRPGDTFYESPDNIHQVSRNASDTAPARFLVHMLKLEGVPASEPVD